MIAPLVSYDFIPISNQVVLKSVLIVDITKVQYIKNITRNIYLYNYSYSSPLVSDGTNIVTVPISCAGMLYTDTLEITYDFSLA